MYTHLKHGQDCYDEDGQMYVFLESITTGAVVRRVFENYDGGGSHEGEPAVFTKALFAEEVTPKLSPSIAAMQAEEQRLREELNQLKSALLLAKRTDETMFKTLKNHAAVRDLVDFLNGDLKYLAHKSYSKWQIQPIDEAVQDKPDRGTPSLRLLSLYGQSKGDLSWRLHQYSDGSGNGYSKALPTKTYQEAVEFVQSNLLAEAQEYSAQFKRGELLHIAEKLVEQMTSFGIAPPPHLVELAKIYAADHKAKNIERLETEIRKKQEELAKAKEA